MGRCHRSDSKTPRQVRHALVYVLNNGKKHGLVSSSKLVLDAGSSARWFGGWSLPRTVREIDGSRPTETARTALLRTLWQKHGLIDPRECPARMP